MGERYLDLADDTVLLEKKIIFLLVPIALQFSFNKISQQPPREETLKASDYIYRKECIAPQRNTPDEIFFHLKFIKVIFHADSAHSIPKFEESNAATAGGYSANGLQQGLQG